MAAQRWADVVMYIQSVRWSVCSYKFLSGDFFLSVSLSPPCDIILILTFPFRPFVFNLGADKKKK
jgi:hypothetical protein